MAYPGPQGDVPSYGVPVFAEPCAVKYITLVVTTRHVGLKILEIPSCPIGNLIVSGFKQDPSQPPQMKTAAEAAGVLVGDVLVSISDTLVAYMTYDDMADVLAKAARPAKFVFARHTMPFNPESARPENIILKQATMLKKGKHFFNVIEHERNFLATLKYLTFVGSKVHAKEVLVSTMTALRHDDERIYVETTVRDYKFRCKSPADKAEWLYSFLCALYLQGNVSSYVSAIGMVSNPALLTETPADPTGAVPSVAGVTEATGKLSVASENISHDLTSVPDAIVAPAAAVSPPSAAGAASGRPAEESSEDEEDEDSGDETATPAGDAPPPTAPAVKKIAVPVPAKPSGPPGGKGVAVPLNTRIVQRVIPPPPSTPPRPVAVAVAKPPAAAPAPAAVDEDAKAQIEFLFRVADTNDDGKISIRDFQGILRKGIASSPLTSNLKSQLALMKLVEHERSGEIYIDKFVEVLSGEAGAEFRKWLEDAPASVMS